MEISDFDIKKYKYRIERSIERNNEKIKDYELRKDKLSIHGYWSLGYYQGINSELENLLDELKEMLNE